MVRYPPFNQESTLIDESGRSFGLWSRVLISQTRPLEEVYGDGGRSWRALMSVHCAGRWENIRMCIGMRVLLVCGSCARLSLCEVCRLEFSSHFLWIGTYLIAPILRIPQEYFEAFADQPTTERIGRPLLLERNENGEVSKYFTSVRQEGQLIDREVRIAPLYRRCVHYSHQSRHHISDPVPPGNDSNHPALHS